MLMSPRIRLIVCGYGMTTIITRSIFKKKSSGTGQITACMRAFVGAYFNNVNRLQGF